MEEYVWHLAAHIADKYDVCVLCEQVEDDKPAGVNVVKLAPSGQSIPVFSKKVAAWLQANPMSSRIVHSHQSLSPADLFTFHSTPYGWRARHEWLKKFTSNWLLKQRMYQKAMSLGNFKSIVPVSPIVSDQVCTTYPSAMGRLITPIPPGVELTAAKKKLPNKPVIGFMGREWDRKGLRKVLEVFREIMCVRPDARLVIAGMPQAEVEKLTSGIERNVELMGWVKDKGKFYDRIRLLLHPARLEAFGMVVTEAMARGIPVLVSDQTGAACEVVDSRGQVLPLDASAQDWSEVAQNLLKYSGSRPEPYQRSWDQVAAEYFEVYKTLKQKSFQA